MREAVLDASPLIFALKMPAVLELLRARFDRLWIPGAVFEEVFENEKGQTVRKSADQLFASGFLQQASAKPMATELGRGEEEAIPLALNKKCWLVADDHKAVARAASLGIQAAPTSALVVWAVKKKIWTKERALQVLEELVQNGYYLHTSAYAEIQRKIQQL